jgi:hypothetical protein
MSRVRETPLGACFAARIDGVNVSAELTNTAL